MRGGSSRERSEGESHALAGLWSEIRSIDRDGRWLPDRCCTCRARVIGALLLSPLLRRNPPAHSSASHALRDLLRACGCWPAWRPLLLCCSLCCLCFCCCATCWLCLSASLLRVVLMLDVVSNGGRNEGRRQREKRRERERDSESLKRAQRPKIWLDHTDKNRTQHLRSTIVLSIKC